MDNADFSDGGDDGSREINFDLVDKAPTPAFGRVISLDDRVAGRMKMRGGVAMGRIIAAPIVR